MVTETDMETVQNTGTTDEARAATLRLPTPQAPLEVAEIFAERKCMTGDALTLRYWRGGWWKWQRTHWAEVGADRIADEIYTFARDAVYIVRKGGNEVEIQWLPDKRKVGNVLDALRGVCRLDDARDAPCWLDGRQTRPLIACANGLLDIAARALQDHTPLYFNLNSAPFDYDPDERCPEFDRFLASLWGEDDETRRTAAQILGYLVSGRTDLHCMFGLIGPRRAGKSTFARLATELLGKGNVAALTQAALGETFGLQHLVGKSLAIISDARTSGKNPQTVVERLLSITGEDAVPVPRKYKDAWQGRLHARVMILSNEMPHFGDASTAVSHRFVMLPFSRSFAGTEDRALEGKLKDELPGILNWALDGLADLDASGGVFAQSKAAREMVEDIAELSSPLLVFMREECELAPAYRVGKDKLYQRYEHWSRSNGMPPVAAPVFAKALLAAGEGRLGKSRPRNDGERMQLFTGIRLRLGAAASAAEKAASMGLETLPGGREP